MPEETNINTFEIFNKINVNEFTEKKGNFTYLSWAWAVRELLKVSPDATWHTFEYKNEKGDSQPYMKTDTGYFVKVAVSVNNITRTQTHPVLDNRNQSIKEPNAFQINTSIQRCLAKAIALHGLGLYIYAGEDLPHVTPLTKVQTKEILDVATKLGKDKFDEVSLGIDKELVHADNFEVTLASLKRRVKDES